MLFYNCFSWNCASSFPVIVCHTIHYWSVLHDAIPYQTYSMVDMLVAIFLILALHVNLVLFLFFSLILSIRPLASRIHIQPSQGGYPCPHHIHIQPPRGGYPCPHHALPIMFGLNCTFCIVTIPGQDELCMCQAFYVLLHLHLHACLVLFATKLHTIRIVKVVYTLEWWVGHLQQWRGPWQLRQYWHLGELGWWGAITMDSCERKEVVGFGYLN